LLGVPSNPGVCPILSSQATLLISVPVVPVSEGGLLGSLSGLPGLTFSHMTWLIIYFDILLTHLSVYHR
jgi:hypothetical protein